MFSSRCFSCHGVDGKKRKAKLRLDVKEAAFAEREGVRAIVPGRPAESALVRRIFSAEKDEVMPPPGKGPALTEAEKTALRDWIAQGAPYREHWAFERPRKGAVPLTGNWGVNEVDRFIQARLKKTGLEPQAAALKGELLRRVTFDITGLPPTAGELDAFLGDGSPRAYEKVVDGLLASPRFGERLAMWWLDGARYGDSHGYDNDLENSQWPWRDWVIRSFNGNKPFDEFTVEQLAGDLLEKPTNDQVIATGFNRNHRINTEGGAIDEEWRTEYVIDRVETMGMVWMGLSLGCARCHEHKSAPLSQKEFYQLFAFFNNLDEKGFINNLRGSAEPRVPYKENPKVQVMIMREQDKVRVSRVLKGGQYDAPGEEVKAGLPAFLPPLPEGEKMSRLGLARWLVTGIHPLPARVVVNRLCE
ncbi:MAG: PSD1 and planctomycete cytochrome C domain-containing protein, partial [Planctomycetes bacterium]|nr:PSD1 and planctomycete cytochrome C domain-containing protein [Planctomycetota bacterium]